MGYVTVDETRSWPIIDGWYKDAETGLRVTLGNRVTLSDYVTLGDLVTLGNRVTLGDGATLGNGVKLGDGVTLGNLVTLGDGVKLGNLVKLGDGVKLGDHVTSLALAAQIRATLHGTIRLTKWVTRDRKSPNFDGGTVIDYPVGAVIRDEGVADDHQCGPGLHVMRHGYRPEWAGLCDPGHDYMAIDVDVEAEDVLFAGLPGNDAKWRVKELRVVS